MVQEVLLSNLDLPRVFIVLQGRKLGAGFVVTQQFEESCGRQMG